MIRTSRQLKALVRNLSKGDSTKAQLIIRSYVIERFLERLSLSRYKNNLVLKGGTLIASLVGLDNRSTMDVDTALMNLPLNEESAEKIVSEIVSIKLDDGMRFKIISVFQILDEAEYPGIRIILDAMLENMQTPLKIDLSSGDILTPGEVSHSFRLLFEERSIAILAYNVETILAEKIETLLSRGTANTRMRDFYDIYILAGTQTHNIDMDTLKEALFNTGKKRGSSDLIADVDLILDEISRSDELVNLWTNYQRKFSQVPISV